MKERPILFSAPMVRALLAGTKTQTRRIYKNRKHPDFGCDIAASELVREQQHVIDRACPYGQPGDRLWVKETTVNVEDFGYLGPVWAESDHGRNTLEYGLTPSEDDCTEVEPEDLRLRPSIFMSRSMSRITLEITAVRVERLQAISRGDAMAEGCPFPNMAQGDDPRKWYADLWGVINGPYSWATNPWVWVVEFKAVQP